MADETTPTSVRLVEMTPERLAAWLPGMWGEYLSDLVDSGESLESARANVEAHQTSLFVDGRPTPTQHILDVLDGDRVVGNLWLSQQGAASSDWFVYNVAIDAALRGRGYGRQAMRAAEAYVRARGGTRLSLNVFGGNAVARSLYASLGYVVQAQTMGKSLA